MTRFVRNRRDGNHGLIVEALEKAGVGVVDLSDAGGGVPDLCCWAPRLNRWVWVEIKEKRGRLRKSQEEFKKRYPVVVARTIREALAACGIAVGE